jgi:U3 small nucleolar RNA-associated protein 5
MPASSLLAALSPDGSRIATLLPTPGLSLRVQIFQNDATISTSARSPTLQSTLIYRRKPTEEDVTATKTTTSGTDNESTLSPRKLLFVSDTLVAVFCGDNRIVVWDLTRGVVTSVITPKDQQPSSSPPSSTFCDVVTNNKKDDGKLYVLVALHDNLKGQIHVYQPSTGKLERKIKAGKGFGTTGATLAVSNTTAVVRQDNVGQIRTYDIVTGQKLGKYKVQTQSTSTTTTTTTLMACQDFVVTVDGGQVILLHVRTCDRLTTIPLDHIDDHQDIDMWVLPTPAATTSASSSVYVRVGSKIYAISSDGSETTLKSQIASAPTVDTRIIWTHHHYSKNAVVYALLQKGHQFQICYDTIPTQPTNDDDTKEDGSVVPLLHLDWLDPSITTGEEQKKTTTTNTITPSVVLGPAQKTTRSAQDMTDGVGVLGTTTSTKKRRVEQETNDAMQLDDDDDDKDKDNDNDESLLDELDETEQGPSIAERLRQLQEALDAEDDDDDDDDNKSNSSNEQGEKEAVTHFEVKKATTESLTQLLQQALQSNDDGMLEMALRVRDGKVLKESCNSLPDDQLLVLLTALTSRLVTRPNRANELHAWISAILLTGRAKSMAHLQPLRNLLEERVAVFPALLKLEGRLGMMTSK